MASGPDTRLNRYGGWLPSRPVHKKFLSDLVKKAQPKFPLPGIPSSPDPRPHLPAVAAFGDAITKDKVMLDLFNSAILQADQKELLENVPGGLTLDVYLYLLDEILGSTPPFVPLKVNGIEVGEPVGVPIYLLFDVLSNTSAAYDLFRMKSFNDVLKGLLNSWGKDLANPSPSFKSTLNEEENGWFSKPALIKLQTHLDGRTFKDTYVCPKPDAPDRGFKTWDEFFVRLFQPGVRDLDNHQGIGIPIHNACESTVYRTALNVQAHDKFWLKGQKYSLYDILDHDKDPTYNSKPFVNGTVYQAFLSPLDYHRWHSPVDGIIKHAVVLPGSYYAALPDDGAEKGDPDLKEGDVRGALIRSQAWLNVSAARALIFIQADSDDIGLVCFVGVGMAEVSSCELKSDWKKNPKVKAGDEIGMFHFGGSSHALIFSSQSTVTFEPDVIVDRHLEVKRTIGWAVKTKTGGSS